VGEKREGHWRRREEKLWRVHSNLNCAKLTGYAIVEYSARKIEISLHIDAVSSASINDTSVTIPWHYTVVVNEI
jgi:hypothetical protein